MQEMPLTKFSSLIQIKNPDGNNFVTVEPLRILVSMDFVICGGSWNQRPHRCGRTTVYKILFQYTSIISPLLVLLLPYTLYPHTWEAYSNVFVIIVLCSCLLHHIGEEYVPQNQILYAVFYIYLGSKFTSLLFHVDLSCHSVSHQVLVPLYFLYCCLKVKQTLFELIL